MLCRCQSARSLSLSPCHRCRRLTQCSGCLLVDSCVAQTLTYLENSRNVPDPLVDSRVVQDHYVIRQGSLCHSCFRPNTDLSIACTYPIASLSSYIHCGCPLSVLLSNVQQRPAFFVSSSPTLLSAMAKVISMQSAVKNILGYVKGMSALLPTEGGTAS